MQEGLCCSGTGEESEREEGKECNGENESAKRFSRGIAIDELWVVVWSCCCVAVCLGVHRWRVVLDVFVAVMTCE